MRQVGWMEWLARQIDATVKGSVLLVVGVKVAVKSDWMENRKPTAC